MQLLLVLLLASASAQDQEATRRSLLHAADSEMLAGRLPEAEQLLRQALADLGTDAPARSRIAAHQRLSTVLLNMGRTQEAWKEISRALELRPEGDQLGGLKHAMAMTSWAAGDLDIAARWMAESVALLTGERSTEVWQVMIDQAGLEMARGKVSRAAERCNAALPMLESVQGLHQLRSLAHVYTCAVIQLESDPLGAELQLRRLLQMWPSAGETQKAPILAQIARSGLRTKRFTEALVAIDEAVALARTSADTHLLGPCLMIRAKILRAMKRKKEAVECEREAVTLRRPGNDIVVDAQRLRMDMPQTKTTSIGPGRTQR